MTIPIFGTRSWFLLAEKYILFFVAVVFSHFFMSSTGLQIRVRIVKLFFNFSSKTYVVGTQKNRLNETVFEHPKHSLN